MDIKINIEEKVIPINIEDKNIAIEVPKQKEIIVNVPKTLDEKIIEKIPKVKDGKTPTKTEIKAIVKPLVPTAEEVAEIVLPKIPIPKDGKDLKFSDLTPYEKQILTGPPGITGQGIARGGTTGQMLVKKSDVNFDTEWTDTPSLNYFTQAFTSQTSVTVNHNFGHYPVIDVIDSGNAVIIPLTITHTTVNQTVITFTSATTGTIIATLGAPLATMPNLHSLFTYFV